MATDAHPLAVPLLRAWVEERGEVERFGVQELVAEIDRLAAAALGDVEVPWAHPVRFHDQHFVFFKLDGGFALARLADDELEIRHLGALRGGTYSERVSRSSGLISFRFHAAARGLDGPVCGTGPPTDECFSRIRGDLRAATASADAR